MKGKIENKEWEIKWIKDGAYELTSKTIISAAEAVVVLEESQRLDNIRKEIEQWHEDEWRVDVL